MKTKEEALKEGNSTINQHIKGLLVQREISLCLSYLMDELFKASNMISSREISLPNYEDIENYFRYPEWSETVVGESLFFKGGSEDDKEEFLANFDRLEEESAELLRTEQISEETHERNCELIQDAKSDFGRIESEPQEILEWWSVDSMMFENLKEKGEPVLEYANLNLWGRTCSGQAILLDHVITEIAADMGILEGQENDWNRRGIK